MEHGFSHFKTNTQSWFYNPLVFVLVAEDMKTGEFLGGVRLEIADDSYELPCQMALKQMDPKIIDYIKLHQKDVMAEGCGLWNSKSVAGKRISVLLVKAAIVVAVQLKITKLIAFLARYTSYIILRMGFKAETGLGNKGDFRYPTDEFIARVYMNDDLINLDNASEEDRKRIKLLQANPVIILDELETNEPVRVHYQLKI